jgi:hypothetical protein
MIMAIRRVYVSHALDGPAQGVAIGRHGDHVTPALSLYMPLPAELGMLNSNAIL